MRKLTVGLGLALIMLMAVLVGLAQDDTRERPQLGIRIEDSAAGVVIVEVLPNSPADEAGLQVGDVLRQVGETRINRARPFIEFVRAADIGEVLMLEIERDGETLTVEVTLAAAPTEAVLPPPENELPFDPDAPFDPHHMMPFDPLALMMRGRLGVEFVTLDAALAEGRDLSQSEGALIVAVLPESPAESVGLRVDDVITAVDGDVVDAERTLRDRLYAYEVGDTIQLDVLREGEVIQLEVTLDHLMLPGDFPIPSGPDIPEGPSA